MIPTVIGFVGLGNMGQPMSARIAAAGHTIVGFDVAGTRGRLPSGASAASSVAELADAADTVLLSLPDGTASLAVAEALAAAPGRRLTTVVDLSTIGPEAARAAHECLAAAGITYADGPVSGGTAGAKAGTLALMFSGPDAVLADHRVVFEAFATVFAVGTQPGQGQAMKLLNNFLSATALAATSEALAFGRAHDLDLALMVEVLNASSGRNTATTDKFPNRVLTGRYDAGFATALMTKDVRLYLAMVAQVGTPAEVGRSVGAVWQGADAALPGSDFSQIWQYVAGES